MIWMYKMHSPAAGRVEVNADFTCPCARALSGTGVEAVGKSIDDEIVVVALVEIARARDVRQSRTERTQLGPQDPLGL